MQRCASGSRRPVQGLPPPGRRYQTDAWRFFQRRGLLFAFRGVVPTGWHAPVRRIDVVCAPGAMLVDRRAGCGMGGVPALAFGDQAVCKWTSAGEQNGPLPVLGRRGNGQWGVDALRTAGRPMALQSVGLGQPTAGAGAVRPAPGIDPRDGRACLNRQEGGGGFALAADCDDAPCGARAWRCRMRAAICAAAAMRRRRSAGGTEMSRRALEPSMPVAVEAWDSVTSCSDGSLCRSAWSRGCGFCLATVRAAFGWAEPSDRYAAAVL